MLKSIPTLVRVFLCPCVGPFPSVGLTLTWFIWDRNLALHITLYSVNYSFTCFLNSVHPKITRSGLTYYNHISTTYHPVFAVWFGNPGLVPYKCGDTEYLRGGGRGGIEEIRDVF